MRVTQSAMTRQYLGALNSNLGNMNKINNRIVSMRRFDRASEDPVGAAKALNIRRSLAKLDMYEDNLKTADSILLAAEKIVMNVSSITQSVTESLVLGANGTQGPTEKEIIASQLETYADEMVKELNTSFAGRMLFGGVNNDTPPFEINAGVLYFNGDPVDAAVDITDLTGTKDIFVDIGLDMSIDAAGNVDPQTALKMSINGPEATGFGTDTDGDPKNLISLVLKAADALRAGDNDLAMKLSDKIEQSNSNVLLSIADLGNRSEYIEFNLTRIESNRYSLQAAQNDVEATNIAEETTNYKVMELAYNATLQMGSALIPPSIFNYID